MLINDLIEIKAKVKLIYYQVAHLAKEFSQAFPILKYFPIV